MKEIVINRCYGGFGLSREAVLRFNELSEDIKIPYLDWPSGEMGRIGYTEKGSLLPGYQYDVSRDHPILIKVVKELKKKASGPFADLKIVKIPDDVQWEVTEYDGMEMIEEVHRSWY